MAGTAPQITPDVVAAHGLSEDEYQRVLKALGASPTSWNWASSR
jgi:phosphoribosylformylglycinamidine synthase